jgi:hypothetical protein
MWWAFGHAGWRSMFLGNVVFKLTIVHYSSFLVVWEWIKKSTDLHCEHLIDQSIDLWCDLGLLVHGWGDRLPIKQWWISV